MPVAATPGLAKDAEASLRTVIDKHGRAIGLNHIARPNPHTLPTPAAHPPVLELRDGGVGGASGGLELLFG